MRPILIALCLCFTASHAYAQAIGMTPRQSILESQARPLITIGHGSAIGASLFTRQSMALFATPVNPLPGFQVDATKIQALRHLIAIAEAGEAGYEAVQHGAQAKPPRAPTQMSIQEIYDWIDETPGQPHAIGRYQFIPETLRRLVTRTGIPVETRFSPKVQDLLADELFLDSGIDAFVMGTLPRQQFMNNLAKIWAGLPTHTGHSHYQGYMGNKNTITRTYFEESMARIFPN